ncbi:hypothetical protein A5652_04415 [Mycobacterium sp. 1165178.9]|nr:hypothetical protein A5652_04415 [Mycobacterium sp. 1165178.9]
MYHTKEPARWSGWVHIDGERISVGGGITYAGGDRKRPARAVLVFTDEDGKAHRVIAEAPHPEVNAYYGLPMAHRHHDDLGGGAYFIHFAWDSCDLDDGPVLPREPRIQQVLAQSG